MNDSSQKQSVDLSALVENHVKVLNYPINLDIAPNGRYTVVCDQAQILQAITNLVINAAESYQAGRKGSIDISLSNETLSEDVVGLQLGARPGEYVRLRVKDTGLGMTPDVLQRAFEPFFTTKASSGHQGLGLSIVFAIVRDHDGFLSAESSSNSGTTISLYLPLIS
jgi:signal transduction histidine kinase